MKKPSIYWATSPIGRSLRVLSKRDQKKVLAITLIQVLMGVLDLLGVIAVGLLGALSVSGLQSLKPGNRVSAALEILHIADKTFQMQRTLPREQFQTLLSGNGKKALAKIATGGSTVEIALVAMMQQQKDFFVQSQVQAAAQAQAATQAQAVAQA